MKYYVYLHIKSTTGEPFYVGKGKDKRAFSDYKRNQYWKRIVNKHGYDVIMLEEDLSEEKAFEREIYWINRIGLDKLCNVTKGGSGGDTISTHPLKDEIIKKISAANIGELNSNWNGKHCTPEWKVKQKESQSKTPIILEDSITGEILEFKSSIEAGLFLGVNAGIIRTCKRTGHRVKKIYYVKDK